MQALKRFRAGHDGLATFLSPIVAQSCLNVFNVHTEIKLILIPIESCFNVLQRPHGNKTDSDSDSDSLSSWVGVTWVSIFRYRVFHFCAACPKPKPLPQITVEISGHDELKAQIAFQFETENSIPLWRRPALLPPRAPLPIKVKCCEMLRNVAIRRVIG